MLDQFSRNIDYMRISLTDRCNLRCSYCMPAGVELKRHSDILSYEELMRIAREAVELGITKFKITGGEPLVRRGAVDFIAKLKAMNGVREVTLTTNGILLGSMLDSLIDAGLDAVNVSIDTLDPAKYSKITGFSGDAVSMLLDTIKRAGERGLRTKINAVLLSETADDAVSLAEIAERIPVDVRFIELMPIGVGAESEGTSPDNVLETLKKRWPDLTPTDERRGNGPAHYYKSDRLIGRIGFIDAVSHVFCSECNRVRLTSTGILKPCLCYDLGTDLRELLRAGISDDELRCAMEKTIYLKPRAHSFNKRDEITEHKDMNEIGG